MIENIKQTILINAIELFKEKGFKNVTINEICKKCRIAKRTFYYHYDSKNTLLLNYFSLVDSEIDNIVTDLPEDMPWLEKSWELKKIYIENITNLSTDILKNIIKIDLDNQNKMFSGSLSDFDLKIKSIRELTIEFTKKGQESGEIDDAFSPKEMSYSFAAAFLGLLVDWSSKDGNYDIIKESKIIYDMIFRKK
ncbi:MAG TPA: TetR/AcrR family transcriptional regulator [Ignavibacteria bacterium]